MHFYLPDKQLVTGSLKMFLQSEQMNDLLGGAKNSLQLNPCNPFNDSDIVFNCF